MEQKKIIPEKLIYEDDYYRVYSALCDNKSIVISGEMPDLICGGLYDVMVEKQQTKYGLQYKLLYINGDQTNEELFFKHLFGKRLFNKVKKYTNNPVQYFLSDKAFQMPLYSEDIENIRKTIDENRMLIKLTLEFSKIGISFSMAKNIVKKYGWNSINIVKENPYILCNIKGIGFIKADKIAQNLAHDASYKESELRIIAGITYILNKQVEKSNTWIHVDILFEEVEKLLSINIDMNEFKTYLDEFHINGKRISLKKIINIEKNISEKLIKIKNNKVEKYYLEDVLNNKIEEYKQKNNLIWSDEQIEFIKALNYNNIILLSGHAGTGKTMSINALLNIYDIDESLVKLVSPTAKAAKVLGAYTGRESSCMTIHRLLGFSKGKFIYNSENKLNIKLLIIDESSMIDMFLFNSLLDAIDCKICMVGDIKQLESVKCGNVFSDLLYSNCFKTIFYNNIYRQREGGIIYTATQVSLGNNVFNLYYEKMENGFYNIENDFFIFNLDNNVLDKIFLIYLEALKSTSINDILIISPYKQGKLGVNALNEFIKNKINYSEYKFSVNDKVRCTKNDYNKILYDENDIPLNHTGVFNGDFGIIVAILDKTIVVDYDSKFAKYDYPYENLELSYCITCHAAQGSQAKIVIGIIDTCHYMNLKRNLLYTMITRSTEKFVLIANKQALNMAIQNNTIQKKQTYLKEFLENSL